MDKRKMVNKMTDALFFLLGKNDDQLNYLMKSVCMSCEKKSGWFVTYRTRQKRYNTESALMDFVMLSGQCGIVIQGEIKKDNDFTIETVRMYRKFYPDIPIIVSTWEDADRKEIESLTQAGAEVILNKKPNSTGLGNVNYQSISTKEGCKRAQELGCEYVLKTRTDQRIYRPYFLEYFMTLIEQFPARGRKKSRKRLIVGPGIVGKTMFLPFMISDFLYFGAISDVETIFSGKESSVNMSSKEREEWTKGLKGTISRKDFLNITAPEMHLIRQYCDSVGQEKTDLTVKSYWFHVKENLICLGWNDINLYWPKYGLYSESKIENSLNAQGNLNSYTWDFGKWLMLYQGKILYNEKYEKYCLDND